MTGILARVILLASLLCAHPAMAVTLAWDAVAETTSYHLHYGQASGVYAVMLDVGPALQAIVTGLTPGVTYYFAATASNATGTSGFSNEVVWREPVLPPPPPPPPPPVPAPPRIRIVTPTHGQAVERKATLEVSVVLDEGGPLDRVECFVNDALLCLDRTSPYGCPWTVPPANRRTYRLQATATDAVGQVGLSPVVEVTSQ